MTLRDLDRYDVRYPAPTRSDYRGYDVYGMSTPSSGGTAVGEALNILEQFDLSELTADPGAAPLPRGERAVVRRPQPLRRRRHLRAGCCDELLSDRFAAERACLIDPARRR